MGKFLSGTRYDGSQVPVCAFWSEKQSTNTSEDYAVITSSPTSGQCIANAYFARDEITCFNAGRCNGEGKCLPCSKYKFSGMRLGITHSPPLEVLREFDGGLTEEQIRSPNLASFPPEVVNRIQVDQIPYHILIRNVQAKVAKCCHWNQGDGAPAEFYLAAIVDGPDTINFTDSNGQQRSLKGIKVQHSEFPDNRGTFFPVGTAVIAGFKSEPSFYLEPRTGLVRNGEGVIFPADQSSPVIVRIKQKLSGAGQAATDTTNATIATCNGITIEAQTQENFLNNALNTLSASLIQSAQAKLNDLQTRQNSACTAANQSGTKLTETNGLLTTLFASNDLDEATSLSKQIASNLFNIADLAETAAVAGGGSSAARMAGNLAGILRRLARDAEQAGFRSFSKCEFFFSENNVAKVWNNPDDGSLPCNGVRTSCQFYTGKPWKYATDELLEIGNKIKGEALQELRFRSDDWTRFDNPQAEFERRFSTPFIWAFKGYVDVSGEPDVEDMLLYTPKVLFGRDTEDAAFQTIEMERVSISDFDNFEVAKSRARTQPGSHTLSKTQPPEFPSLISKLIVPTVTRLSITHPRRDKPFVYRTWTPDKNKITLFGTGTPNATVFIVNETALRESGKYHDYLGTRNIIDGIPSALPGSPNFTGILPLELQSIFSKLEDESRINDSKAPLGYATVNIDTAGAWSSIQKIDLVHNTINKIFAFILVDQTTFIFDSVEVDYRFLHSIPVQTSFRGSDFSMVDAGGGSFLSSNVSDTIKHGEIKAELRQIIGNESVKFSYGYYGMRFISRGLKSGTLNADNDIEPDPAIVDEVTSPAVATAPSTALVNAVGYTVYQYRRKDVTIDDWYVIDDCGSMMIIIADKTANRVLPLPSQSGSQKALSGVLVNGGGKGSEIAQFGIESAKITVSSVSGEKKLVQVYRDSDGFGLPANYIVLGPSPELKEAFGRANPDTDTIKISYTYLKAQSADFKAGVGNPENSDEVVESNFYSDSFRTRSQKIQFEANGQLTAGGAGNKNEASVGGAVRELPQEYVWVLADSEERPLGRKYSRMLVMYYGLSCINIEIYYAWRGSCSSYALFPDLFLTIGSGGGQVVSQPQGVTDPKNLHVGFRLAQGAIGSGKECINVPSCGDHEFLFIGGLRREFEVIERTSNGKLRAVHVGAGAKVTGELISSFPPLTDYNKRRGALWYPYTVCDPPRYDMPNSIGPQRTQSTELINEQLSPAGFNIGANVLQDDAVKSAGGSFGGLPSVDKEAYRGVDLVRASVLDIHTTLRPCTENYTYGNQVLDGRISEFAGASRKRGAVEITVYGEKQWQLPRFGNLGRSVLFLEVSDRRGDYITDKDAVGFRWMPIFPERENLGAGIGEFSENMEPQLYRLLQTQNPAGSINETVDFNARFTQRGLIRNQAVGNLEYPFIGYFPRFLSDELLGKEPLVRKDAAGTADISTMWAWRERDKPIKRSPNINDFLAGVKLQAPEYFLDNRGVEVRLRPDEGSHAITYTMPRYDIETGKLLNNGSLKLANGPAREIVLDFFNKQLSLAAQEDSVYDTSLDLGDGPFSCSETSTIDGENFQATCTCEKDITNENEVNPNRFPARFMHLEEVAPEGFFVIYESVNKQPPFAANLARTENFQPCCQCVYYIRGLFASLDLEYLPSVVNLNPARDGRISMQYTWSRVPHGAPGGFGRDGGFQSNETLNDNYIAALDGSVFTNSYDATVRVLDFSNDAGAIFPARTVALAAAADSNPIDVVELANPSNLNSQVGSGGQVFPATNGRSGGENEPIALDFRLDGYSRIRSINIHFFAGRGWEIPIVSLIAIDPQTRGPGSPRPTFRKGRVLAKSSTQAVGANVPNRELLDETALREGFANQTGAKFTVNITPSYSNQAFWNKFAMEFQLIFERRSGENSMGIAGIEVITDTMPPSFAINERIEVFERKYYTSKGSPSGGKNPEGYLTVADSASAYWRASDQGAARGGNKFRAYSWGAAIDDNQGFEKGSSAPDLEKKQEAEYDIARSLFSAPYTFTYSSFIPKEEQAAIVFYGGSTPSWINTLTNDISKIDKIGFGGDEGSPIYGKIPDNRVPWSAPGHAWTYKLEDNYLVCCPECPKAMVINYNFAHLHDNLDVVETARFWDELPSGLTNLLRSSETAPDPFFGQGNPTAGEAGGTGQAALLAASSFEGVEPDVLEKAGFRQDDKGNLIRQVQGGE